MVLSEHTADDLASVRQNGVRSLDCGGASDVDIR
jgi:hypothetical protein